MPETPDLPRIPRLEDVHVRDGCLRGTFFLGKGQRDLLDAYQQAMVENSQDRPPIKMWPGFQLRGPLEEFATLARTEAAAVGFTSRYGPLLWGTPYYRLVSRRMKTRKGSVDRAEWSVRLSAFWLEQQRFRAAFELGVAVKSRPEDVAGLLKKYIDPLFEILDRFGVTSTADALNQLQGGPRHPEMRVEALRWFDESQTSKLKLRLLASEAGEMVARIVDAAAPPARLAFDGRFGFRHQPHFASLRDVLYFLLASNLPTYRFCLNCNCLFYQGRADKNTCGQRCAQLLGKRVWARRRRREQQRAKRAIKR